MNRTQNSRPARIRPALLGAGAIALGTGLALGAPLAASAHVTVTPDTTAAGSYAVLTFSVGHGCEGSPTESVAITIPEPIAAVTPTITPGWQIEKVMAPVEEPSEDAHGETATERVSQVVYTADTPLEDGYRTTFALSLQLPADAEGETLAFPALQTCTVGETDWADADPEADAPAPTLAVTAAAEGAGHGHGAASEEEQEDGRDDASAASATGGEDVLARVLGIAGLAIGAVGIVVAVASRRSARS
ncbi:YcnI family copper-binding membrane protein [Homoserinibacter sp. YIM 151385]|uniref:YcnI family copper-binding membrane protein n=1 Tax=Homoserinibacter sp. YIM 151385 TaxID=2985506 RepID=UPI0022F09BF8|nr:YcnI family protein [Homoserinibacter sp. YIM 151385]WBU39018.1 YcnI family protein [Homoserinibacter sp. YIM 151385]